MLVIGVAQRSGTHLVHDFLCLHPQCVAAFASPTAWGSTWEDYLVPTSADVGRYRSRLLARWRDEGFPTDELQATLDGSLSGWLSSFLRQLAGAEPGQRPVTKTPSATDLHLVADWLLADVDVVIVVRDPRAVLQSARVTFGDSFERRLHGYVHSARAILRYRQEVADAVLVRYEDLQTDRTAELQRLLVALGLDPDVYDYEAAAGLPIRGSSTSGDRDRWRGAPPHEGFDALRRGDQLPARLRRRVEWAAGPEMAALGYTARERLPVAARVELRARDAAYAAARSVYRAGRNMGAKS
ncbi:MAG: sulfotransferase [Acidimicrobiales bacterium]|nr:sulfotransferase [Acidimicrobiales bacterium]